MKTLKKALACILALAMLFALTVPVFAEDGEEETLLGASDLNCCAVNDDLADQDCTSEHDDSTHGYIYIGGFHFCPQYWFVDRVPKSHWAHDSIDYVLMRGIMSGTSSVTFEPDSKVTRAMVAVMLYNLSGTRAKPMSNPFSDVPNTWYTIPVIWAYKNGIVSGYGDGTFNPTGAVTREQLAIMMQNYAQYIGKDVSADVDLDEFADADEVSPWALDAVKWAYANGIIKGLDEGGTLYLDPQGNATRAQIAVIFENFCKTFGV